MSTRNTFIALLAGILLYCAALELASRRVVPSMSEGLSRIMQDYRATLTLTPTSSSGATSVLLVGNSLLLDGVIREDLREYMSPEFSASIFPIQNTTYFDWYFGMRRYFAEGARPSAIGLCMTVDQILSDATNAESFARFMMQVSDFPAVVKASHLDNMTASNYFFAHWSMWLATRTNVRNGLSERLMPSVTALVPYFRHQSSHERTTDRHLEQVVTRLNTLQELSIAHGAEFVWIVPPTMRSEDDTSHAIELAARSGITVLRPYQPGELPPRAFKEDGFHLAREGAEMFTSKLARDLKIVLQQRCPNSSASGNRCGATGE